MGRTSSTIRLEMCIAGGYSNTIGAPSAGTRQHRHGMPAVKMPMTSVPVA